MPHRILLLLLLTILIGTGIFFALKEPRSDRDWLPEYARTTTIDATSTSVTIHNVRDWTYSDRVLSEDWTDVTVDPTTVTRAWFIVEPFSSFEGIGHTFLSFEFKDAPPLSFSIQARQEKDEKYSTFAGLFNTYELAYQWGTERDFIGRRAVYLKHDLRMYPLTLTKDDAQRLLISLIAETNELAARPRFYNTFTANCTNMLAKLVNKHYPGRLPFDVSWELTGYSDLYLMNQDLIAVHTTKEETREEAGLAPHRAEIAGLATSSPQTFSQGLRSLLGR